MLDKLRFTPHDCSGDPFYLSTVSISQRQPVAAPSFKSNQVYKGLPIFRIRVHVSKPMQAPDVAIKYWSLPEDAKMRDLLLAVRADEAGALETRLYHTAFYFP